jgi:glycosyltransferase involved in cell wall biosynthesis
MISIITPCYNQAKFLDNCLHSVYNQDYTDWECIIVNDGSNDDTAQTAQIWLSRDKRFKYIEKENGGLSSARNAGLDIAKGKYVFFLDSDDLISKDCLTILYNESEKYNVDVSIAKTAYCNGQIETYYDTENFSFNFDDVLVNDNLKNIFFFAENHVLPIGQNKLYKSEFLNRENIRFKPNLLHEDELFFFLVINKANKIKIVNHITYFYNRGNPNSITNNITAKNISSNIYTLEFMYEYYQRETCQIKKNILAIYMLFFKRTILYFFENMDDLHKAEIGYKFDKALFKTRTKIGINSIYGRKIKDWKKLNKIFYLKSSEIKKYYYYKSRKNKLYKFYDLKMNLLYFMF